MPSGAEHLATATLRTPGGASPLDQPRTVVRVQRDVVLRGLAENPAVTVDVLVGLLHDWPEPVAAGLRARAALPVVLQERMADHELWPVRCAVAGYEGLDPVIRDALLRDPDWR